MDMDLLILSIGWYIAGILSHMEYIEYKRFKRILKKIKDSRK